MENTIKKGGLLPYTKDERELKLGAIFDQPRIEDLPDSFSMEGTFWQKDQGNTDKCAGASSTGVREVQEGVELDYEFIFALAKMSEPLDSWGASLDSIAKAWIRYGTIERKDRPKELEGKDAEYLRDIKNWPNKDELLKKAALHKAKSYMWTKGRYTPFDNLKTWIYKFRNESRLPVIGINFGYNLSDIYFEKYTEGSGHAMFIHPMGWCWRNGKEWLVVQNSYGAGVGENGHHYLSREVIDRGVTRFGAIMFQDMPVDEARKLLEANVKADTNILIKQLALLINYLKQFVGLKQAQLEDLKKNSMEPSELLYKTAVDNLGRDVTPKDEVDDEVSCAFSLNAVYKQAFGKEIGGGASTAAMYLVLKNDKRFEKTSLYSKGCIIISPTGYGNGSIRGHVGIMGENERIMSNTSKTGLWESNMTLTSWIKRYRYAGDLPILFYRPV